LNRNQWKSVIAKYTRL